MQPTSLISSMYEVIVIVFFLFWFIATVICQFKETNVSRFIRQKIDMLSFIPLWTFFAPNPGKKDYHLIYRDKFDNGILSEWKEIEITEERHWWSCFWNPQKRDKKVLSDIIQNLITLMPEYKEAGGNNLIACSLPYIIVLSAVSNQQQAKLSCQARQFMLAESTGYQATQTPGFILLSLFHSIK